jgi:ubiquinone/menaquinone biosynthesis C-methylase UbiE
MAESYRHPIFARCYAWLSEHSEGRVGEYRARLLSGLSGRVVEVGAGNGLNFAHYPPEVDHVLAVEPEPHLRGVAERNAQKAVVHIDVVPGFAEALPTDGESCDAAVCSLVLCSVPDQAAALSEIHRVLRPGGQLRLFEHVRADTPGMARLQRLLDASVWPQLAGGCHTARDTVSAVELAGLRFEHVERFRLPESGISSPVSSLVLGTARRP